MTDLSIADRFGEGRDDNPYWNESVWFSFSIPERLIHGSIQYYFRPNMGMLNGGPNMWHPSARFQWNALYYNWSHLQAMPAGAQKFDMQARNSLKVKMLEPMKRYKIDYDKEGFEMDLVWEAIGPAHELHTGDAGQQATAKFHIEQPGRMTGMIRRHGEDYPIDCYSMRDTSYGAREYESLASGGYFWGIAESSTFHALCMDVPGTAGREAKCIGGFIWQDGQLASLVSGRREVLEFDEFGGAAKVVFEAADKLGRTIHAKGTIHPGLIFTGYTDHTVQWSLAEWDWNGVLHWGDNQEFMPSEPFRQIARGEISRGD